VVIRKVSAAAAGLVLMAGVLGATNPASAATADTVSGSAYGIDASIVGGLLTTGQSPLVTLPATGAAQTATAAGVAVPLVLNTGVLTAHTTATGVGTAAEVVHSSGGLTGLKLLPASLTLTPPVLAADAVGASCTSTNLGSTAAITITGLSIDGTTVTLPTTIPPNTPLLGLLSSTLQAILSPVATITLNVQTPPNPNQPATTGISTTAMQITLLGGLLGSTIDIGHAACGAAGPDIDAVPTVTGVTPASGPAAGGTTVTVTGTGLLGVTTVDFGPGNPGTITADSATSITVTAPSGTGVVDVTATNPFGTSPTSPADQYTYVPPTPVIGATGLTPTSVPTTGGTTVTITGTGLAGATAVDFGATPATIVSDTATSLTVTSPPGTAGAVPVTVTTPGGTAAAGTFTYATTTTTTVPPAPTVSGITPSSGVPSGGNPVTIVGSNLCNVVSVTFGGTPATGLTVSSDCTTLTVTAPAGEGVVPVVVTTAGGASTSPTEYTYVEPGYWMVAGDGGVFSFGGAKFYGSMGGQPLNQPIVAMAETPDHQGYWLFAKDGGVFAFGDAHFYGSVPGVLDPQGRTLNGAIVAAEATPDGHGYRMFAADGGVFDFGDAAYAGSLPALGVVPNKPVVAAVSAPVGQGYLLVAADGGVFTFGDALYEGSLGAQAASGIVSISETSSGNGYWVFGANGAVYPFGDAVSYGNAANQTLSAPIVFGVATTTAGGYWLFATDGGVFAYGDAPFLGSLGGISLVSPIVGGIGF